jgi:hypothetical protein
MTSDHRKLIDSFRLTKHLKGIAFEYLVGLYLQNSSTGLVIPQARLLTETSHPERLYRPVYIDHYIYNPKRFDGEITEVKWKGDKNSLDQTIDKLLGAAQYWWNEERNAGNHVNIDTYRQDRKVNLIVHDKLEGFQNEKANYHSLEELATEPYRKIEKKIEQLAERDDKKHLEQLAKALFGMYMYGFEEGIIYNVEQYVNDHLEKNSLLPKHLEDFIEKKNLDIYGTAHARINDIPIRGFLARSSIKDENSAIFYLPRKSNY